MAARMKITDPLLIPPPPNIKKNPKQKKNIKLKIYIFIKISVLGTDKQYPQLQLKKALYTLSRYGDRAVEMGELTEQVLPVLVQELRELQATRILKRDCDLKITRKDFFPSKKHQVSFTHNFRKMKRAEGLK